MRPAARIASHSNRVPILMPGGERGIPVPGGMVSESFAKDSLLAWFQGEFTAANAIIDELMGHIADLPGFDNNNYVAAAIAIHRRRMNWVPVIKERKFCPITEVAAELRKVAKKRREEEKAAQEMDGGRDEVVNRDSRKWNQSSSKSAIPETGSQALVQHSWLQCTNQDEGEVRCAPINPTQGFISKEPVKLHMVNVVKGLKVFGNIFTDTELSKLRDYVNELRVAGQNGELLGATFIGYDQDKQQVRGGRNKSELIQLGAPFPGHVKEDATNECLKNQLQPIPATLQGVVDHLVQLHLIPEDKKPNSCIINYFDEGEFSDPFMKPPHLEYPISTLLLSESEMAFGDTLVSDNDPNYEGLLMLSLKEGSLLVMSGKSADVARHVMCSSQNKRISITFFRVQMDAYMNIPSPMPPMTGSMTLSQTGFPTDATADGTGSGHDAPDLVPKRSVPQTPVVMVTQVPQMALSPTRMSPGGTGVFFPSDANNSRGHKKNLPPRRSRKGRKDGF